MWGHGVRVPPSAQSLRSRIYCSGLQELWPFQGICHYSPALKIATSVHAQANKNVFSTGLRALLCTVVCPCSSWPSPASQLHAPQGQADTPAPFPSHPEPVRTPCAESIIFHRLSGLSLHPRGPACFTCPLHSWSSPLLQHDSGSCSLYGPLSEDQLP